MNGEYMHPERESERDAGVSESERERGRERFEMLFLFFIKKTLAPLTFFFPILTIFDKKNTTHNQNQRRDYINQYSEGCGRERERERQEREDRYDFFKYHFRCKKAREERACSSRVEFQKKKNPFLVLSLTLDCCCSCFTRAHSLTHR